MGCDGSLASGCAFPETCTVRGARAGDPKGTRRGNHRTKRNTQEISMATGLQAKQCRTAGEERGKGGSGKGEGPLRIINQLLMNAKLAGVWEDLRHQKTTDNRPASMDQVNKVAGKAR